MAAILRVKRRNEDEPLDALVIACKRRKTVETTEIEEDGAPITAVVKFAGTIQSQDEDVLQHVTRAIKKKDFKINVKEHTIDVLSKIRDRSKQNSIENRYKVINCIRAINNTTADEDEGTVMTVIDVEDSASCAVSQDSTQEKDDCYVYDLYYAETDNNMTIEDAVSVYALEQELVFDTFRYGNRQSEYECESEDSNSESNWRNDYPDSDHSEGSIDDDDMENAVRNIKLADEASDLSSDEDFVYALDEMDVERYGYKYAKYKARNREDNDDETNEGEVSTEDTDESDEND